MNQNGTPAPGAGDKKGSMKLVVKIGLVAAIFIVVFYLIYFTVQYGRANFILSNQEIASDDDRQVDSYKVGEKIYFFINRNNTDLEANLFVMEIEFYEGNEYKHYKQISYEIDKNFPKISAYIPTEYFSRSGKYRIKASLDGKLVATNKIEVSK